MKMPPATKALFFSGLVLLLAGQACQPKPPEVVLPAPPFNALPPAFFPEKLAEMDQAVRSAISSNQLPGAVLWVERDNVNRVSAKHVRAFGQRAVLPQPEPMTEDTIFDAASLTKVMATAPSIMILAQQGKLKLDDFVARHLPEFAANGKERITIRQLLTHTSGLRPGIPLKPDWHGYESGIALACAERPAAEPDTVFRYSDINFILLGELVRRVSGQPLDRFSADMIFRPLGMNDTGFLPPKEKFARIAPTEKLESGLLRGEVHDPTSRRMGGVTGHAGLFTAAADLAKFARFFLEDGASAPSKILSAESVRLMSSVQTPPAIKARRGLGWDIDSPYVGPRGRHFPVGSFGHTGWTGTSVWIDPFSRTFVILLSNRNHPDESGNVLPLRSRLGALAAEAVRDFNFLNVPGALARQAPDEARPVETAEVLNGIDVLKRNKFQQLRGLKVGLITNHTGADRERNSTIDLLHGAEGVQLAALFSPEHGIRGLFDEKVGDSRDEKTGLPVHSLYGERRSPSPEQLAALDALVFDIQDIGCRFYTYISTMGNCLEAAAKAGKKIFVLDRVNPIGGVRIEGPVLRGERTFTGWHEIAVRHGMTVGELARMFNEERGFKAELTVIPLENWRREMLFDHATLPWINPSPNMRSLTQAILYPGIGLLETTALSVGRGTDTPFEMIGAPYIDELRLAKEMNLAGLPGVRFVPVRFTPSASVYKGQVCRGVNIILTSREECNVVDVGIALALNLHESYSAQFGLDKFNRLLAHAPTIESIRRNQPLSAIKNLWNAELNDFRSRREKYLLYM